MYQTWFCGVQLEISAISGSGAGSAEAGDSAGVDLGSRARTDPRCTRTRYI